MSRDEIEALQSARLVKVVNRVYHNVEYYRKKMQAVGLEPGDIKGIEDLDKLPYTTYADLRDTYPFGLAAVPRSEMVRVHASSGTTGKPKIAVYTRRDIDIWAECVARCLSMAGITKDDIIQIGYGYGLFTGGLGAHYGAEYLGALVLPMSTGNTQKLIDMMIDCDVTSIACTPSYLLHVAEDLEKAGLIDKIKLKSAICGAEPWTDEMRDQMEARLHIKAYDIYGLTEMMGPGVACDCEYHKGLHIWEDHFLPEIIDPATQKQLPKGSDGELVITNLTKEGMPLIRYRTKDLTSIEYDKCECGRTAVRMGKILGRSDDMMIIRGVNVFPSQVESILLEFPEYEPYFLIEVDRVNNTDTFDIQVEVKPEFYTDQVNELVRLRQRLTARIQSVIGIQPNIKIVQPGTIERSTGKAKRAIDHRKFE